MDFSKLLHGFLKVATWIFLRCYMDLSKLIHGFLQVVKWICQNWCIKVQSRCMDLLKFLHEFLQHRCISRTLPIKLKFHQPWVQCAVPLAMFGYILYRWTLPGNHKFVVIVFVLFRLLNYQYLIVFFCDWLYLVFIWI